MGTDVYGDLFIQLRAEILANPDSWLTETVYEWYDFLYRKSDDIDTYQRECTAPEGFEQYDYSSLQNFLISVAVEQGRKSFNRLVNGAIREI